MKIPPPPALKFVPVVSLSSIVLLFIVIDPKLRIPPPKLTLVLLLMVLSVTVSVPVEVLKIPPPPKVPILLLVTVLVVNVSVPRFKMPLLFPFLIVTPLIWVVAPGRISITLSILPPSTMVDATPAPLIVRLLVISRSPVQFASSPVPGILRI